MSESSKSQEPGAKGSRARRNGEKSGSHTDPPHSKVEEGDEPEQPAAEGSHLSETPADEPDHPAGHSLLDGTWGLENGSELTRLLNDAELMDRVVSAMIENSKAVDKLAKELSTKLREALENDDEIRQWLIDVLMLNQKFRRRVVKAMVKSFD
jgi:hypothetical protein